jgi:hypothetical protein
MLSCNICIIENTQLEYYTQAEYLWHRTYSIWSVILHLSNFGNANTQLNYLRQLSSYGMATTQREYYNTPFEYYNTQVEYYPQLEYLCKLIYSIGALFLVGVFASSKILNWSIILKQSIFGTERTPFGVLYTT